MTRFYIKPALLPDVKNYPFIHDLGDGYVEVTTSALLDAFLAQETRWLNLFSESIKALDERADQVQKHLPEGAQILPATLDEADRAGYIDGLRAGARTLSIRLGQILKPDARPKEKASGE